MLGDAIASKKVEASHGGFNSSKNRHPIPCGQLKTTDIIWLDSTEGSQCEEFSSFYMGRENKFPIYGASASKAVWSLVRSRTGSRVNIYIRKRF